MAIKKNDFSSVKKKFSTSAKYKPQRFFDLGSDFLDAVGLPGPAIGHRGDCTAIRGHRDPAGSRRSHSPSTSAYAADDQSVPRPTRGLEDQ